MPLHLHLCDRNTPLCDAWRRQFSAFPLVTTHLDDFFSVPADIMVLGGNAYGFMDVGLELAITLKLGGQIEERLRTLLLSEHGGILPIGHATYLQTFDRRWPYLIVAPTMWLPMDISDTIHPYLATRAALRCFQAFEESEHRVWHVLMPGMGTGVGRVPPAVCALQMRCAYEEVILGKDMAPATLDEARQQYQHMIDEDLV